MVDVIIENDKVVFNVKGIHKVLALKSRIEVPREHIASARIDSTVFSIYKGIRAPGTYIPGLITAGTFRKDGKRIFWDVFRKSNAIVVDLVEEKYSQLVIEVAEPAVVINMLNAK